MSKDNSQSSMVGTLLIASPYLLDPNFRSTVVLIARESEEGILGYVLNRRTEKTLAEFWEPNFGSPCSLTQNIYVGGPIYGPLVVLHQAAEFADFQITGNLFFTMEKNLINNMIEQDVRPARFILGQSGWSRDQLNTEIENGFWFTLSVEDVQPFGDDAEIWISALQKSAEHSLVSLIGEGHFPVDPSQN